MRKFFKNSELKIPIFFNFLLFAIIYSDYYLPSKNIVKESFVSFYSVTEDLPRIKGGVGKNVKYILKCSSGNLYQLPSFPEHLFEIEKGQKLFICKTQMLSKIKSINLNIDSKETDVSIMSNKIVNLFFILAIFMTVLNLFFSNSFSDSLLAISSVYIYLISFSYLFYFE